MKTINESELDEVTGGTEPDLSVFEWQRAITLEWIYYLLGRAAV